jgi:ADP-ribose pyrophosphatase
MADFKRSDVEIEEDRAAWRGFFQVREYRLRHRLYKGGWGRWLSRELFVRGPAVGVLPYDPVLDCILQVEQFRVGAMNRSSSPWIAELVAGIIDKPDECPEDVARREAQEEAGIEIKEMESIAEYYSSPGGSDEYLYLYCGRADLSAAGGFYGLAEEGEAICAKVMSFAEAMAMLDGGQVSSAHNLIALQWLRIHRDALRQRWLA